MGPAATTLPGYLAAASRCESSFLKGIGTPSEAHGPAERDRRKYALTVAMTAVVLASAQIFHLVQVTDVWQELASSRRETQTSRGRPDRLRQGDPCLPKYTHEACYRRA